MSVSDDARRRANAWLDRLASSDRRIAENDGSKKSLPADEIWRDDHGNVLARNADGTSRYVMVQFERPMMEAVADVICRDHGTVLNVGFGCGLVDAAIQARGVARHVIVEAHPQVVAWMKEDGWHRRPNVEMIDAAWEDVPWARFRHAFDGVFFDTYQYGTGDRWDQTLWYECVRRILKPRTGVAILYGVGWTPEAVEQVVRGFFRDHVTVGWTRCRVEVPFEIVEWSTLGVGTHEIELPYFSLTPKVG